MIDTIASLLPALALVSHIAFVALFVSFVFRESWGRKMVLFIGKHSLVLGFLVSLSAVAGSLFYSEIMGFEACILCWWQRILLYPTVFIFAVALWRKELSAYYYIIPPVVLASIIAVYQSDVALAGAVKYLEDFRKNKSFVDLRESLEYFQYGIDYVLKKVIDDFKKSIMRNGNLSNRIIETEKDEFEYTPTFTKEEVEKLTK